MRDIVRANFVIFTSPLEGVCRHMYVDVKGLVTTAIGNLIDPIQLALPLPFEHLDGNPASRDEIAAEWLRVKNDLDARRYGYRYAEKITSLRLSDEGVSLIVSRKLEQNGQHLRGRFPEFEEWPACAQLATLSLAWACGPAFRFPELEAYLRSQNWAKAAQECKIDERGNPGLVPRNIANAILFRNAARVRDFHLDPDTLEWIHELDVSEYVTPVALPYPNPASTPTIYVRAPLSGEATEEFLDLPRKLSEDDDDGPPEAA